MDDFDLKHSIAGAHVRTISSTSTQPAAALNVSNRSQTNVTINETGSIRHRGAALDAITQVELIYGKADANLQLQVGALRARALESGDDATSFVYDQGNINATDGDRGILPRDLVVSSLLYDVPEGATVGSQAFGTLSTAGAAMLDTFAVEARAYNVAEDGTTAVRIRDLSGITGLNDTFALVASDTTGRLRYKQLATDTVTGTFKRNVDLSIPITAAGDAAGFNAGNVTFQGSEIFSLASSNSAFSLNSVQLQAIRDTAGNATVTFNTESGADVKSFDFRILDGPFFRVQGEGSIVDSAPKAFVETVDGYAGYVQAPFERSIDYPGYSLRMLNSNSELGKQGSMITAIQFTGIDHTASNTAPVVIIVGDNYEDPTFEMDDTLQAPTGEQTVSTGRLRVRLADAANYLTTAADFRPLYARFQESAYAGGAASYANAVASYTGAAPTVVNFMEGDDVLRVLRVGHEVSLDNNTYHVTDVTNTAVSLAPPVGYDVTGMQLAVVLGTGDLVINHGQLKNDVFNITPTDRYLVLDGNLRVGAASGFYTNARDLSIGGATLGDSGLFLGGGNALINAASTTDIASTTFRVGPANDDSTPHFWLMGDGSASSLHVPGELSISTPAHAILQAGGNVSLGSDALTVSTATVIDLSSTALDADITGALKLSVGGMLTTEAALMDTNIAGARDISVGGTSLVHSVGNQDLTSDDSVNVSAVQEVFVSTSEATIVGTSAVALSSGAGMDLTTQNEFTLSAGAATTIFSTGDMNHTTLGAYTTQAQNTVDISSVTSTLAASAAGTMTLSTGTSLKTTAASNIQLSAGDSVDIQATTMRVIAAANAILSTGGGFEATITGDMLGTVTGAMELDVGAGLDVGVDGTTSVHVANGPLLLSTSDSHFVTAGGAMQYTATNGYTLSTGGVAATTVGSFALSSGGVIAMNGADSFTLSVANDATVNAANTNITADGTVTLSSADALEIFATNDANMTASDFALSSAGGFDVTAVDMTIATSADYDVSAGGATAMVAVAGPMTLSSGGAFDVDASSVDMDIAGAFDISATGAFVLVTDAALSLSIGTAFDVRASSDASLSAGGNLTMDAAGAGTLSVSGNLDINSANLVVRSGTVLLSASDSLEAKADSTITVSAGSDTLITSGGSTRIASTDEVVLSAGSYFRLIAPGDAVISAGGVANIVASSGLILSTGDATVTTTGNLSATVSAHWDMSVGGGASVDVAEAFTVGAGDSITLSAVGNVGISGSTLEAASVGSTSLSSGSSLAVTAGSTADISAGGALAVTSGAAATVSVVGDFGVTSDALLLSAAGAVDVRGASFTGIVAGDGVLSAGGNLLVDTGEQLDVDVGSSMQIRVTTDYALNADNINEAATGDWRGSGSFEATLSAGTDVELTAGANTYISAGGIVDVDAQGMRVDVTNAFAVSADTFDVFADSSTSLSTGGELAVHSDANVYLRADAALSVSSTTMQATFAGAASLSAGGALGMTTDANMDINSTNLNMSATTDVELSTGANAEFYSGDDMVFKAAGDMTFSVGGAIAQSYYDYLLIVEGNIELSAGNDVVYTAGRDLELSVGGALPIVTGGNASLTVGGTLGVLVADETTISIGGATSAFVNGAVSVAVADSVTLSSSGALSAHSSVIALKSTQINETTTLSVAGSLETTVSGPNANTIVEGSILEQAKTDFIMTASQGAVSVDSSTATTITAGTDFIATAGGSASLSSANAIDITSGTTLIMTATDLSVGLDATMYVEADAANLHLTNGGFAVSATDAIDIATIDSVHMVAPTGFVVEALAGLSMGSAIGAGNLVVNNTAGIRASTTSSNIQLYSTHADGPSIDYGASGGKITVPNNHTFEVKGTTGTFDVSVNEACFTNDVEIKGDLRVKGSQIIEGGTTNIQTRDLVLEDRTIELGVAVADANTVVHLSNIAPVGDFSVATDLSTLSQDLASAVKFPGAGADAWPWFRPYDVATSVAGNAYVAALVDVSVDVDAHYTGREIYSRSDGFQDFANGIIYDPIVSHYKYMKSFPVAGGNIIILKTSGSTLQPSGANVEVYSNAFLYGINGDYETQEWPMDSSVGVFSADAPEIAPKLYSDGISNEAGLIVRANKTESLQWYKSSGQQTSPYWRLTSDVFIGETNLFHFADKGNESSSHWFFSIDEASGSMQLCYGTRASYLLSASWDKPLAI